MIGKKGQEAQEFRTIVEYLRQKRNQFVDHAVPQFMSWLVMMRNRYSSMADALAKHPEVDRNPKLKGAYEGYQRLAETCDTLASLVIDPWPRVQWYEAVSEVAQAMGIVEGKDMPNFRPGPGEGPTDTEVSA